MTWIDRRTLLENVFRAIVRNGKIDAIPPRRRTLVPDSALPFRTVAPRSQNRHDACRQHIRPERHPGDCSPSCTRRSRSPERGGARPGAAGTRASFRIRAIMRIVPIIARRCRPRATVVGSFAQFRARRASHLGFVRTVSRSNQGPSWVRSRRFPPPALRIGCQSGRWVRSLDSDRRLPAAMRAPIGPGRHHQQR